MVTCSSWYPSGERETTYDLSFSIASSAAFGTPLTTVLSRVKSLFAVSSSRCTSSSLLSPTAWYNSQFVPKIQRQRPTSFISMITLAMENATLTGLVSTQSGNLLRSVCTNREATPRPSFVIAFQSEMSSSSKCVQYQSLQILSVSQLTLTHSGSLQIWNIWWRKFCWLEGGGGHWCWANFARSVGYVIWREVKSSSITLRWSQYTYLTPSSPLRHRFLGQDRERPTQKQKQEKNSTG